MAVTTRVTGQIATVTIDNPPVNAASHAVRQGLVDAVATTQADDAVKAVILLCAGRTFVAGADIREFGKPPLEPHLPDVVLCLERATKPWIAAIHGAALGGGLEIALGCSHRICLADATLGLPEVKLGLIPGAGGTVRLPRLIKAEDALQMISSGKPVCAGQAHAMGLVDRVVDDDLASAARDFAAQLKDAPRPPALPERAAKMPQDIAAWDAQKAAIVKKAKGQNAPVAAVSAIDAALTMPATDALVQERATFLRLKSDPQSAALRHIFFAERNAGKLPKKTAAQPRALASLGVVGGGTMGAGIAAAALLAGFHVTLIERDETALEAGAARIRATLAGSVQRGLISKAKHAAIGAALSTSTDYAELGAVDLVIEAVFEDMEVKRAVFQQLDKATRADAVLATNTSYLDVNDIAASVADPARVIGLHFFSPAHIMKLLEVVIPDAAVPDTIATGLALGKRLGKISVLSGVCDGFIGNRIMSRYRRACDDMLVDGALPAEIDSAMRDFGFPMGLYEMQDLAGLDIAWAMRKRQAATRDPNERYVTIADQLCEAGHFGRKTGKGWYIYNDGKTPQIDPATTALIEAESAQMNVPRRSFTQQQIMARILDVMQEEARALLSEGIAQSAADIDVVMVNGYGFPRWRGGPMFTAETG
ncbi:MAG: 3-hydroxyacyl-CoA dehydrogenase NAD-binding domain-containing protein [Pseudomonadota bacterium]